MRVSMRASALVAAVAFASGAALAACSSASGGSDFQKNGASGGSGGQGGDLGLGGNGGSLIDAPPGDGPPLSGDCSDAAKLIYVVSEQNDFLSFSPPTLTFKPIGKLSCNAGFATPFSMGVARNGTAWVLFSDGHIFNVSTTNAACTPTGYLPGQNGWTTFGMGFVSDSPGSSAETLYVADYNGGGLGKIDLATLKLSYVGPWDKLSGSAELSGTGDARLFGFWEASPVTVAEIDKSSGHILATYPQPTVNIGSGWAFAHWGGSFWLFTAPLGTSQVDQFDPATNTTKTVKTALPYVIVGAGVSTCAPTVMPH
jgi:hypothetical protein